MTFPKFLSACLQYHESAFELENLKELFVALDDDDNEARLTPVARIRPPWGVHSLKSCTWRHPEGHTSLSVIFAFLNGERFEVCSCIHLKCLGILPGCTKPCRTHGGNNKKTCLFAPKIIMCNPKTQYKILRHLRWMQEQTFLPTLLTGGVT